MSTKAINLRTRHVGREVALADVYGEYVATGKLVHKPKESDAPEWAKQRFTEYVVVNNHTGIEYGVIKDDAVKLAPKAKPRKVNATELTDSDVGKMISVVSGKILAVDSPYIGMLTHRNGNGNVKDAEWPFVNYSVNRTSLVITDTVTFL